MRSGAYSYADDELLIRTKVVVRSGIVDVILTCMCQHVIVFHYTSGLDDQPFGYFVASAPIVVDIPPKLACRAIASLGIEQALRCGNIALLQGFCCSAKTVPHLVAARDACVPPVSALLLQSRSCPCLT